MEERKYLSVTALNRYLSYKFEVDLHLQSVYLEGEVSNFKRSGRHYYFSLKDQNSEINAIIFYPTPILFEIKDGMVVKCVGKIQVYEKRGSYAIVVQKIEACGVGSLYQQYLELKAKLDQEGLFSEYNKLKLPPYPLNIAIITSPTGEAINDIISTFNRRLPLAKLTLFPALVQGVDAPKDLVRALKLLYYQISEGKNYDALIIGRGGGSFEDLACFNDEQLARLLFASPIPTISAVGHEGDYTICDFVASLRAPTPTGAAVFLTKDRRDLIELLDDYQKRLKIAITSNLRNHYQNYLQITKKYGLTSFKEILNGFEQKYQIFDQSLKQLNPQKLYLIKSQDLNNYQKRLEQGFIKNLDQLNYQQQYLSQALMAQDLIGSFVTKGETIDHLQQRLKTMIVNCYQTADHRFQQLNNKNILLNPLNLMAKGYSIVYQDHHVISKTSDLDYDQKIMIQLEDGIIAAQPLKDHDLK